MPLFFNEFFDKKWVSSFLDTIGNYSNLTKNPRAIENSRVKLKKFAFFSLVFYNLSVEFKK